MAIFNEAKCQEMIAINEKASIASAFKSLDSHPMLSKYVSEINQAEKILKETDSVPKGEHAFKRIMLAWSLMSSIFMNISSIAIVSAVGLAGGPIISILCGIVTIMANGIVENSTSAYVESAGKTAMRDLKKCIAACKDKDTKDKLQTAYDKLKRATDHYNDPLHA